MADNRTMAQLLQAPTEGYRDAIVIPEINANFELKHGLINLNEITRFQQRFDESFYEAWDPFYDLLRAYPHHEFFELQHNTFYNALNANDQDSLNSAAGGNFLDKMPRECLRIIESKSKVRNSRNKAVVAKVSSNSSTPGISPDVAALTTEVSELKNMMKTMLIDKQKAQAPAPVKAVEQSCVTCGGAHSYRNCPATDGNVNRDNIQEYVSQAAAANFNQGNTNPRPPNRVSNQMAPPGFQNQPFQAHNHQFQQGIPSEITSYMKANESIVRNMQGQINEIRSTLTKQEENLRKNLNNDMRSILGSFFQNQASTSGTLSSNTIPNPKGEMKAITTRSEVAYEGPSIPTNPSPKKEVERETEEITNKEQTNFQGSTAQIPPSVIPIPEPDVPKTLPKTTPIPESDIPKNLPKPNIPYPSRRDDQKFAPTIKSLLMNKEKLLELAKIPLNENCSAMLLKKLPEKLGDPGKFLIPCNFPGMDVCHALADLGASINLMPLSIWKKLSLPELTPTRMTLELADRSITRPKGLAEDIFVKVENFHFPTDFVVVNFEADPRVPLILGRSFLRTSRALIDVYEGELVLRDGNEQITFHVNGTSKHSQKHENESIKMVNDTCKDSFKRFTDEPTQVCPPPPEDVNDEKEKQEVKNLAEPTAKRQTCITPCLKNFKVICKESIFHSNKPPQLYSVFAITSTLPKDSLIMGDDHLSTFSTEEIVPIPREFKETSRYDSKNVLPSCDDFSSIKVPRDNSVTFSNPLFKFDVNFNNPLFDEEFTPLSDSNKDESLIPRNDIEFLLHDDPPFEENDDLFDLECKTNDEAECFNLGGDDDEIDVFLAIKVPTYNEGYYDSEGDVTYLESLLSDDTTHNLSPKLFFDHEPQQLKNEPENEYLITFSPKSDPLHHEFTGEIIMIPLIVREHEDYINRMSLLCSNSSSQSPKNFHTIIESLPTSTTLIEDSDPNREEIDIFSGPDDSIPPVINNVDELNEDECFDPGGGENNVEVDDSFTIVTGPFSRFSPTLRFLPYFPPPGMKTPFMTPTSSLELVASSSGWNFHVRLLMFGGEH
ncbi:reverse transcriptase domain-containing protein [Tanacetum coccineum]